MCLNDPPIEFDQFRRLGLNVLIPEYVGYGMSGGKPSETGCRETADAASPTSRAARTSTPRGSSPPAGRSAAPSRSTWRRASRSPA